MTEHKEIRRYLHALNEATEPPERSAARGPPYWPRGYPSGHRLLDLWTAAKPIIAQCGDPAASELANVENNIREFQNIDPGAHGFRYPMNLKQSARSMPNAPDYVNLRVLHEGMEAVANFLSAVRSELGVRLDHASEMARAYGGE